MASNAGSVLVDGTQQRELVVVNGEGRGTGAASVSYSVERNIDTAARSASWLNVTTGGSGTGNGSIAILQQSDPRRPRTGDNPAAFSVAPNTSASSRTGTITVRDQVVTITQKGS